MKLSANSLVAKVAYGAPSWCSYSTKVPNQTSLCPFFWRFVVSLVLRWPLLLVCSAVLFLLEWVVAIPIVLLFGYRPGMRRDAAVIVPYTCPTIRGYRIVPGYVIIGFLLWQVLLLLGKCVSPIFRFAVAEAGIWWGSPAFRHVCFGAVMGGVFLLVMGIANDALCVLGKSSVMVLVRARLRAAKEKACPIITFEK
jgi:hypothetical protein